MSPPRTDQLFKDDTTKENFLTGPLDDDIQLEDQTSDRQLCIHDAPQLNLLSHYLYPCANLDFATELTTITNTNCSST